MDEIRARKTFVERLILVEDQLKDIKATLVPVYQILKDLSEFFDAISKTRNKKLSGNRKSRN